MWYRVLVPGLSHGAPLRSRSGTAPMTATAFAAGAAVPGTPVAKVSSWATLSVRLTLKNQDQSPLQSPSDSDALNWRPLKVALALYGSAGWVK